MTIDRSLSRRALVRTITAGAAAVALTGCAAGGGTRPGIYRVEASGSESSLVIDEPARPVPSPDGAHIAWSSDAGIRVMSLPDGEPRTVAAGDRLGVPAWSPNGWTLAWTDSAVRQIVFADVNASADGAGQVAFPLIAAGLDQGLVVVPLRNQPTWAPDGSAVAYVAWDGNGDEVYRIAPDGSGRQRLSNIRASREPVNAERPTGQMKAVADAVRPDWSPTGGSVAFAVAPETAGAPGGVYAVGASGGRQRRLSPRIAGFGPLWSPDGTALLVVERANPEADLLLYDVRRGVMRNLTYGSGLAVLDAAWSPDGRRIAFSANGAIHVHHRDQRTTTLVADTRLDDRSPCWMPDGRTILFAAVEDLFEQPAMPDIP